MHSLADEFAAEVARLRATTVTEQQWQRFLQRLVPDRDSRTDRPLSGRSRTLAMAKRARLTQLYTADARGAPWTGTAYGVIQAVNTYEHHHATIRGATRPERNLLRTVTGDCGALDRGTWRTLSQSVPG